MSEQENHFTLFKESIDSYDLPERFTFPFYYQPHPLCLLAVKQLQEYLKTQQDWQHNFGLIADKETAIGKMFGVLLVENKRGEIGYISAFSGKIADSNHLAHFVPPVFDMLTEGGFIRTGHDELRQMGLKIKGLEANPKITEYEAVLSCKQALSAQQIQAHRASMIVERKDRKERRTIAKATLTAQAFLNVKEALGKESIKQKNMLKDLTSYWDERIQDATNKLHFITDEITALKKQRKDFSHSLQQKLFDSYHFFNKDGVHKNLRDIFKDTPQQVPPAGAGECAAPKLLNYAFNHNMKPLAMAEFWWGKSPKSEVRKHQHFYAACLGKCQPILGHMLKGITLDDNPLLNNPAEGKSIDIVYQDDVMVVISKPAGFLSVPGKNIEDSVYLRMKQQFPIATGPLIVHRLDMATSGLMVIALNKAVHKKLQQQFISRTVKKRYVALLDGLLMEEEGTVDLPLRVDLDDRPRQLVCYKYGKAATTTWQLIEQNENQTKVYFYPITGRTHQLRVHSAHIKGLNIPIVGDDLYGQKSNRLYLHAETLELAHPISKELMIFQLDAEF